MKGGCGIRVCVRILLVAVGIGLLPGRVTVAQGTGAASVSGVVRDASSALVSDVVIEATSPALIERVRTTFADIRGGYF